jgi:photosystem II stability/assembly factor-like uncharacterized protein
MKCTTYLKKYVKLLALLLLASASNYVLAGPNTSEAIVQFTPHDRLFSVAFNGDFGEAVGESGLVLQSTDGGKTWRHEVSPPTRSSLFSVAISGSRSIAVGQQGLILIRDGRKKWRKIEPVTDQRLLRVSINKNGLAVAVGAFGTLLRSIDYGETWAELKPDWATLYENENTSEFAAIRDEPTLYAVKVFDDGSIVISGEYGQINRSTDGGITWTPVFRATAAEEGSTPPTLFGMNFRADGIGYAAGQEGMIVASDDSGKSWRQMDSGSKASLFDIASTQGGHVFAVGMRTCLVSADAGRTWQPLNALDVGLNWYSGLGHAAGLAGDSIIAVGHSGRVLKLVASAN